MFLSNLFFLALSLSVIAAIVYYRKMKKEEFQKLPEKTKLMLYCALVVAVIGGVMTLVNVTITWKG